MTQCIFNNQVDMKQCIVNNHDDDTMHSQWPRWYDTMHSW